MFPSRGQDFVSQHIGDLDNAATCAALEETVERLGRLLQARPAGVAHDLHPDFFSSRFAADFARSRGLPRLEVQHHHAHIAAVMAEHGLEGEVLGLALDGVGQGDDGGIWGGELLRFSATQFRRLGHLRELLLPGGDKAARITPMGRLLRRSRLDEVPQLLLRLLRLCLENLLRLLLPALLQLPADPVCFLHFANCCHSIHKGYSQ